jgi:hypothetical protein
MPPKQQKQQQQPRPPKPKARWTAQERLGVISATGMFLAAIYRFFLFDVLNVALGLRREVQPVEDFPYDCHRIEHPLLQACEDLWLDHAGRRLYASCGDVTSRTHWNPGGSEFNHTGRGAGDHIAVLDIDHPGADGLFGVRALTVAESFPDAELQLHNVEARRLDSGTLRFWLVNHRVPVNETTGELLPVGNAVGSNDTIEIFDLDEPAGRLDHVRTIASPALVSVNNIAAGPDGRSLFFTNDHTNRAGLRRDVEALGGGGNVGHCDAETGLCLIVRTGIFNFPNGIARGKDGLYYVANTVRGLITVFKHEGKRFFDIDQVYPQISLDNISVDADGNLIVAAFPYGLQSIRAIRNPFGPQAPATVLKIEKIESEEEGGRPEYKVSKMIEDRDVKFLPTATVAVHDVQTERLFISGVTAQHIAVCQKRTWDV